MHDYPYPTLPEQDFLEGRANKRETIAEKLGRLEQDCNYAQQKQKVSDYSGSLAGHGAPVNVGATEGPCGPPILTVRDQIEHRANMLTHDARQLRALLRSLPARRDAPGSGGRPARSLREGLALAA